MPNTVKVPRSTSRQTQVLTEFVEAALVSIHAHGIDRVTVAQVLKITGASRPTFYSYFGSIEGLFAEVWVKYGLEFFESLSNREFRLDLTNQEKRNKWRALLEIFTVSHRIPEIAEISHVIASNWWRTIVTREPFNGVLTAWLAANRLGMWLTHPIEPRIVQAEILEGIYENGRAILSSTDEPLQGPQIPALSNPELNTGEPRSDLLAAAMYVVSRAGIEKTSMSRIARQAQMTTGAMYPRFSRLDDLLLELFDKGNSGVISQNLTVMNPEGFTPEQFGLVVLGGLRPERKMWRNFRIETFIEGAYSEVMREKLRAALERSVTALRPGLALLPVSKREQQSIAYLTHTIGLGMALLLNAEIPVDQLNHPLATSALVEALAT